MESARMTAKCIIITPEPFGLPMQKYLQTRLVFQLLRSHVRRTSFLGVRVALGTPMPFKLKAFLILGGKPSVIPPALRYVYAILQCNPASQ